MRCSSALAHSTVLALRFLEVSSEALGQAADTWQPIPKEDRALKDNPANPGVLYAVLAGILITGDPSQSRRSSILASVANFGENESALTVFATQLIGRD
jgi:hypothetical protein